MEKKTSSGQKIQFTLPDGSKVWQNAETSLKYPAQFDFFQREIFLEGEIFIDVKHQQGKPFTIHTQRAQIRVLGTSLNIKSYAETGSMETVVLEGQVQVVQETNDQNPLLLSANERAVLTNSSSQFIKEVVDAREYIGWKEGTLRFENESLAEILRTLERWYGVDIEVTSESLYHCRFTGRFHKKTLSEILNQMSIALNIHYTITQKVVTLSGPGC
ncbi:MAG: FecR family protein [Bacteroidia bacterium]|nr:FecR family protein [Bacteroidia bacterium]